MDDVDFLRSQSGVQNPKIRDLLEHMQKEPVCLLLVGLELTLLRQALTSKIMSSSSQDTMTPPRTSPPLASYCLAETHSQSWRCSLQQSSQRLTLILFRCFALCWPHSQHSKSGTYFPSGLESPWTWKIAENSEKPKEQKEIQGNMPPKKCPPVEILPKCPCCLLHNLTLSLEPPSVANNISSATFSSGTFILV